jgi:hypothetical protein
MKNLPSYERENKCYIKYKVDIYRYCFRFAFAINVHVRPYVCVGGAMICTDMDTVLKVLFLVL